MEFLLLTLHAQTSIHAGSGQNDGVVDLPIQRESHTGYPCVFGSSVKGALRTHAQMRADDIIDNSDINTLFGKEGGQDNGQAGALLISDARLLLLPIRSLTGQFRWITCPAILKRFKQDCSRFGLELDFVIPPDLNSEEVLTVSESEQQLYLEEYRFNRIGGIDSNLLSVLTDYISYENGQEMLEKQLAIVSDDDFAYLAKYTLPVTPHIAIDSKTKTTLPGALWYEETLPADSILYTGITIEDERKRQGQKASDLAESFKFIFEEHKWLQVGGNETTGMGWCSVDIKGA